MKGEAQHMQAGAAPAGRTRSFDAALTAAASLLLLHERKQDAEAKSAFLQLIGGI